MISNILCVCTGNICRSPLAEGALQAALPDLAIRSAGLHAVVGHPVEANAAQSARDIDLPLKPEHSAHQIGREDLVAADLVLVMDKGHLDEIRRRWPEFSGKTLLMGHFEGGREIPDPYRRDYIHFLKAAEMIRDDAALWASQISAMKK